MSKELVVLGFDSRELAEEARERGASLMEANAWELDGAALAHHRDDGRVELVQPMRLAGSGAASGSLQGGAIGFFFLQPVLFALIGAATGAAGAGIAAGVLNAAFVREVSKVLAPGRAALMLMVGSVDDGDRVLAALSPLRPVVVRTTLDDVTEAKLLAAFDGPRSDRTEPGQ